jgi:hypothetical protein
MSAFVLDGELLPLYARNGRSSDNPLAEAAEADDFTETPVLISR